MKREQTVACPACGGTGEVWEDERQAILEALGDTPKSEDVSHETKP